MTRFALALITLVVCAGAQAASENVEMNLVTPQGVGQSVGTVKITETYLSKRLGILRLAALMQLERFCAYTINVMLFRCRQHPAPLLPGAERRSA